ncbi:MAG: SusC/RagA family TonB-linked outer membrane protein [Gemmatimonadaceae bacterium]
MTKFLRSPTLLRLALVAAAGFFPAVAQGQGAVISGRVMSEQGQPLVGANLYINDLNISVGTSNAGAYSITIPQARLTNQPVNLRVRAIGYLPQTRIITLTAGTQTINFDLRRDVTQLSEVVVTGVATATEQVKLPFTVARIDTTLMPVTGSNPIAQLQGKIPGAMIVSASGRPGSAPSVVLRGPVSLNATGRSQGPLYLLDGVPLQGSLPDINPSDIENVEVVKGAAAAALYGARAGAGVINITTKSGKNTPSGFRVGVKTEFGAGDIERAFPLSTRTTMALNPSGQYFCTREVAGGSPCARYIDWDKEVDRINNSGEDFSSPPQNFLGEAAFASAPNFDALSGTFVVNRYPILRDPVSQLVTESAFANTNVDMRGKINNTGVFASLGNLTQQGAIQNMGGFARNSARINVDQRFGDRISFNINTFYSQSEDHGAQLDTEGAGSASPFFTITRAPRMANLEARDALGRIVVRHNPGAQGSQNFNPLYAATYNERTDRNTRFVGGTSGRYTPVDWLNLEGTFGYDRSTSSFTQQRDRGWRTVSPNPVVSAGFFREGLFDSYQYTGSLSASANRTFFGDLNSTLTTRYIYGDQTIRDNFLQGDDIVVAGLETADAVTKNFQIGSGVQKIRDMGFFVGADFDFKDRYILSGLVRRDGSSLFGAGNRWQSFGRLAGAWIVSRESWFPAPEALSLFKLRASRGSTGQRPRFSAQYETFTIGTGGTLNPAFLGNKNLKPEINTETEVGTDLELFRRFGISVSYARAVIDDQILPVRASTASGFSSQWLNAGEVTNQTWEGTLTVPIFQGRRFNWTSRLIYDQTTSEITRLDVPDFTGDIVAGNTFTVFQFRKGEKVGTMYGNRFITRCSDLPGSFVSQCSQSSGDLNAAFRPNDEGYIVWVGQGNLPSEGITKNLYRSRLPRGEGPWGNQSHWGMPMVKRDSTGAIEKLPLGSALPKHHWGLSQTIDFGKFNVYGLLDASRGQKLFNIQYAWSLGDLQSGDVAQDGKTVESAKPMGYYWRQGASTSPTPGNTTGLGGFYDNLGPNSYNIEDASYVKLRELAVSYRLGSIGGSGDWKLGFVGRNLKTWTDFRGFDPESGNTSGAFNSAALTGVSGFRYPKMRTYTFQLSTSF